MKYEFHVGDYVETKNGAKGYIIRVEGPWWRCTEGKNKYCKDFDYIVASIEEDIIVKFYSRIGQYDFTKKDDGKIKPLCDCTDKELRFGHNIEKLFRGNTFKV